MLLNNYIDIDINRSFFFNWEIGVQCLQRFGTAFVWCPGLSLTRIKYRGWKVLRPVFHCHSQPTSIWSSVFTFVSTLQNQMPMPPSLPASSPAAQSASNAPGSGTPVGSMGPGSASGAGPLPNMSPSTTSTQSNAYPHCPPIRTNSPSPAPSLTPQPRQTPPPTIPRSQTPQPLTPGTPQQPQQASQQQLLGQTGNSEKASQLPQQTLGAVASSGPQAGPASSVPSQNAHVPLQLPQTPVSTFYVFSISTQTSFQIFFPVWENRKNTPTETLQNIKGWWSKQLISLLLISWAFMFSHVAETFNCR